MTSRESAEDKEGCDLPEGRAGDGVLPARARPWVYVALALIVGAGTWLRLWNNDFGIPHYYHVDERNKIVKVVVPMVQRRSLDPDYFLHPAMLLYSTAAGGWLYGELTGEPVTPLVLLRSGRTVSAIAGALTLLFVFLLGERLGGPVCGLLAALLLGVFPLHVQCSHYMKEDVFVAMWVTLQLFFCAKYVQEGRRRDLFLAAASTGLATATKYVGSLSGVFLAIAFWMRRRKARRLPSTAEKAPERGLHPWRYLAVCFAVALVCFLAVNPAMILKGEAARRGMHHEFRHAVRGHLKGELSVSPWHEVWTYHLRHSLLPGMGVPAILLAAVGAGLALKRRHSAALLIAVAALVGYVMHEASPLKPPPQPERYMVLILPMLAALAAYGALLAWRGACNAPARVLLKGGVVALAALAVLFPLARSIENVNHMVPDTRDLAAKWLRENCEPDAKILVDGIPWYAPPIDDAFETVNVRYLFFSITVDVTTPDGEEVERQIGRKFDFETRALSASDVAPAFTPDYLVLSSFWYDRFINHPDAVPSGFRFYTEEIPEHLGAPAKVFRARRGSYGFNNPEIRIYRLR